MLSVHAPEYPLFLIPSSLDLMFHLIVPVLLHPNQCILRGTSIVVASSIMSLVSFTIKLILCQQENLNWCSLDVDYRKNVIVLFPKVNKYRGVVDQDPLSSSDII